MQVFFDFIFLFTSSFIGSFFNLQVHLQVHFLGEPPRSARFAPRAPLAESAATRTIGALRRRAGSRVAGFQ
jgi:hypothetical protein